MKSFICLLISVLFTAISVSAQIEPDTIYYDKDWKGVEFKSFATYYRIIPKITNTETRKQYRDFYITGELQSEGEYISIDTLDDSRSMFNGECFNYYKSGQIAEKLTYINGIRNGEYIKYNENGLILINTTYKNGKLHGIYSEFSNNGNTCTQVEYYNGEFLYDYYVISDNNGCISKIRISDNKPIYESPSLDEKQVEYKNGEEWPFYNKNGIIISMTNNEVRDYGKYYQIPIIITNNSLFPIDFEPNNITASMLDKNEMESILKVLSAEEYMKKVSRRQNWAMALNGLAEGLAASGAGYSTSTTNSSYSGYSSSYGNAYAYGSGGYAYGNYSGNTSYYGSLSSTTTTYNAAAAYQAQVIASNRIAAYDNALLSEREAKDEGYLKRTTIYPGKAIYGYINIERIKGAQAIIINIDINGAIYTFPWNVSH